MAGFQRSEVSFRRQGSSGLVWDDRFLSGDLSNMRPKKEDLESELRRSQSAGTVERSPSKDGAHSYRTVKVSSQTMDPPSPKVSGCGLCGMFGKSASAQKPKSKIKRRSRY